MSDKNQFTKKTTEPRPERRHEPTQIVEIISLDVDEEGETPLELSAETTLDLLQDAEEEAYDREIGRYTFDKEIQESLEERQALNNGARELQERLAEHHATSPELSGGDLDAAWEDANVGEETAGGMAPTPDQDMVEEIGEAYGITYKENEPLHTGDKLAKRDAKRWELNPQSAEDTE